MAGTSPAMTTESCSASPTPSLRGANATKQSNFLIRCQDGLLRRKMLLAMTRLIVHPHLRILTAQPALSSPSPAKRGEGQEHSSAISPHDLREFAQRDAHLEHQRAQGKPGARCTRSLACKNKKHTSIVTTGSPETPGIPCAMVLTVSFVLSSVTGFVVTVIGGVDPPT